MPPNETELDTARQASYRPLADVLFHGVGMYETDGGWPWRPPRVSGDGILDHNTPVGLWGKGSS